MSAEPGASAHLYLFIYANDLLTCAFALNKNISLFTYYNRCQQKQVQAPTCICLFMQNCLLTCAFNLNIYISWFTYENRCQHKQMDATTCICLFMQSSLLKCAFPLNINIYLFTYDNLCQHKQVISFFFQTSVPELNKEYISTSSIDTLNC